MTTGREGDAWVWSSRVFRCWQGFSGLVVGMFSSLKKMSSSSQESAVRDKHKLSGLVYFRFSLLEFAVEQEGSRTPSSKVLWAEGIALTYLTQESALSQNKWHFISSYKFNPDLQAFQQLIIWLFSDFKFLAVCLFGW